MGLSVARGGRSFAALFQGGVASPEACEAFAVLIKDRGDIDLLVVGYADVEVELSLAFPLPLPGSALGKHQEVGVLSTPRVAIST